MTEIDSTLLCRPPSLLQRRDEFLGCDVSEVAAGGGERAMPELRHHQRHRQTLASEFCCMGVPESVEMDPFLDPYLASQKSCPATAAR